MPPSETPLEVDGTEGHDTRRTGRAHLREAFGTPRWLRDLGRSSWLLVGLLLLLLGLIWLLAETYTIVGPMVCALIVAVVAMPIVRLLDRHMPRALAAALVLLSVLAIAVLVVVVVVAGITGQSAELSAAVAAGVDKIQGWLKSSGVDSSSATGAATTAKHAAPQMISTLVHGIVHGIRGLASILFGLSFAALGHVLPAQGRAADAQLGRPPRRAAGADRAHDLGLGDHLVAGLLPRRHARRCIQRRRRRARRRCSSAYRSPGRSPSSPSSPPTCRTSAPSSPARSPS